MIFIIVIVDLIIDFVIVIHIVLLQGKLAPKNLAHFYKTELKWAKFNLNIFYFEINFFIIRLPYNIFYYSL